MYQTDGGVDYAVLVDADYADDPEREWFSANGLGLPVLPRGMRPREVFGFDSSGRKQSAKIPTTANALWVGTLVLFRIFDTNRDPQSVTVVGREREFLRAPPL